MSEWMDRVTQYVEEYAARGMVAKTVVKVQTELVRCMSWQHRRRPRRRLEEMDADLIARYVTERAAFRSKSTVATLMSILRGFGEFLVREGVWVSNPLRWMRGPKRDARSLVPRRLNHEAMQRLWQVAATCRQGYRRQLWLAVLGMLYGTGARREELVGMDVEDWIAEEGLALLDGRKTGWPRRVPVPELTWQCLEAYRRAREEHLAALGIANETALFVNRDGVRFQAEGMSRGLKRLAARAGVEGLTLHRFRHTCASDLLEAGASVAEVQEVLGHRTISTTMRYLQVADPQLHGAAELHPVNAMLREERATAGRAKRVEAAMSSLSTPSMPSLLFCVTMPAGVICGTSLKYSSSRMGLPSTSRMTYLLTTNGGVMIGPLAMTCLLNPPGL